LALGSPAVSFFGNQKPESRWLGDVAAEPESLGNTPMLKALIKASQSAISGDRRAAIGHELGLTYTPAFPELMGPEAAEEALQRFAPSLAQRGTVGELMEDLSARLDAGTLSIGSESGDGPPSGS